MRVTVPSLYVRVYRRQSRQWKNKQSSLTVCEGISPGAEWRNEMPKFPHCM